MKFSLLLYSLSVLAIACAPVSIPQQTPEQQQDAYDRDR